MRLLVDKQQHSAPRRNAGALWVALAFLVAGLALATAPDLRAEPYFSVRDGYKCSKCHVNKTGGGKRSDYAKAYMETRMAMSDSGAVAEAAPSGDFGHGRITDSFSISADFRQLVESRRFLSEEKNWHFGRRAACESCHGTTGGGKIAEVYEQFEVMPGKASIVAGQSLLPGVTSREAFGLLEFSAMNSYFKAGLFRMPTGLRNTFDDPYIHGVVDYGNVPNIVGLETVRGSGVEFGVEPGPYSLSLSVTTPGATSEASSVPARDKRLHLNGYTVGRLGLVGATWYKDPIKAALERTYSAVYGGMSLGRITGLAQVDSIKESDPTAGTSTKKQGLLAEIDFLLSRGQNIKWQYEAFDPDTSADNDKSDRNSIIYEPFVTSYLQLRGGVRRSEGPRTTSGLNGTTVFMEVHLLY